MKFSSLIPVIFVAEVVAAPHATHGELLETTTQAGHILTKSREKARLQS
jgi:hypothetical protein